ncbi:unnamed protein product [Victoria cruziana]
MAVFFRSSLTLMVAMAVCCLPISFAREGAATFYTDTSFACENEDPGTLSCGRLFIVPKWSSMREALHRKLHRRYQRSSSSMQRWECDRQGRGPLYKLRTRPPGYLRGRLLHHCRSQRRKSQDQLLPGLIK